VAVATDKGNSTRLFPIVATGTATESGRVSVRPGGWFALVVRVSRVNRFGSNPHKITGQRVGVGQGIGSGQGLENSCEPTKSG
jgi:hypothetical protein